MIQKLDKNEKLKKDFDIIIKDVLTYFSAETISIINYGSYGRFEGAFYYSKGEVFPYNDYDIMIVVSAKVENSKISELKKTLNTKISIQWLDISQIGVKELSSLPISIFNYDLKYGSKVIYGNYDILDNIPAFQSSMIPLKEIETLYFTRLWTLLGSFEVDAFSNGIKGESSRFFRYQLSKAVFAIIDVLLIQNGNYHHLYKMRVIKLKNLFPGDNNLNKLCEWALNEKLEPKDVMMSGLEAQSLYAKVLKLFLDEMFIGLDKFYDTPISSTSDIEMHFYKNFISKIKLSIGRRFRRSNYKYLQVRLIQSYIVEAFLSDGIEKKRLIEIVRNKISRIDPNYRVEKYNWDELRYLVSQIRLGIT
jgi:hypothetical protein